MHNMQSPNVTPLFAVIRRYIQRYTPKCSTTFIALYTQNHTPDRTNVSFNTSYNTKTFQKYSIFKSIESSFSASWIDVFKCPK